MVLDRTGDAAGAEQAYRDALAHDAMHVPSLLNLTANLHDQGKDDDARVFARRALELKLSPSERTAVERFVAGSAAGG